MIRDVTIIGVILLSIVIGHIAVQSYLKTNSDEIVENLETLREQVLSNNTISLKETTQTVYNTWKEKAEIWAVMADHQEIDIIEKSILNIKAAIDSDDMDQIIPKIDESIFLISLIEDKEKLSLKNIF